MHVYLVGAKEGHVFTEVGQTRHCVRITQIACANKTNIYMILQIIIHYESWTNSYIPCP